MIMYYDADVCYLRYCLERTSATDVVKVAKLRHGGQELSVCMSAKKLVFLET